MFADIEADIYVLVDGDDTYDAAQAPSLIEALLEGRLDYVNGRRVSTGSDAFRTGHRFGNWLLTSLVAAMFGNRLNDMLSGYKVLSRRFVKSFPALASGFETETELAVHALDLRMPMAEIEMPYKERPPGSASKLSTFRDGYRIPPNHPAAGQGRAPAAVFRGHIRPACPHLDRPRLADRAGVPVRTWTGAAPAYGGPRHQYHAARL